MKSFFKHAFNLFPFWYILVIWFIKLSESFFSLNFGRLGVHPLHWDEWYTFLTGALFHSDFQHLMNNTYPLALCGLFVYFLFQKYSNLVFILSYLLTGLFIFLFARSNTYHIGASGVAYSWAFLLAASGFFRKDRISLGLGLLVVFLYGSMIWGVLPIQPGVSWDGHLFGAIAGIFVAYLFRNINRKIPKEETEDEDNYSFENFEYGDFEYLKRQRNQD